MGKIFKKKKTIKEEKLLKKNTCSYKNCELGNI